MHYNSESQNRIAKQNLYIRIIILLDCNIYKSNSVMVEYLFCTNNYYYGTTIETTFNKLKNHKFYRFQVKMFFLYILPSVFSNAFYILQRLKNISYLFISFSRNFSEMLEFISFGFFLIMSYLEHRRQRARTDN
jgi:hypothetical protein